MKGEKAIKLLEQIVDTNTYYLTQDSVPALPVIEKIAGDAAGYETFLLEQTRDAREAIAELQSE